MTKLDERISLELEQDLKNLFEESVPCEVPSHREQPHCHEGDGEWYVISGPCAHCGVDNGTDLICDKFKRAIEASMLFGSVPCSVCEKRNRVGDIVKGFERRNGNA